MLKLNILYSSKKIFNITSRVKTFSIIFTEKYEIIIGKILATTALIQIKAQLIKKYQIYTLSLNPDKC